DPSSHVATGLRALGDHEIASRVRGGDRLRHRPDLPGRERAPGMDRGDQLHVGGAVEELDHAGAGRRHRHRLAIGKRHQEVHAEYPAGPGAEVVEYPGEDWRGQHHAAEHSERSRLRDRERERRRGDGAHPGLLQWDGAAEQAREAGLEHGVVYARALSAMPAYPESACWSTRRRWSFSTSPKRSSRKSAKTTRAPKTTIPRIPTVRISRHQDRSMSRRTWPSR